MEMKKLEWAIKMREMYIKLVSGSDSISTKMRKKRFKHFENFVGNKSDINILDVGGTELYWNSMDFMKKKSKNKVHMSLINLDFVQNKEKDFTYYTGTAIDMKQFQNKSFDVVFSNSVLEHVGNDREQKKMADEVMRVGKSYYIQTPNKYFPIEPHFMFPFFAVLPFSIRVWLVRTFALGINQNPVSDRKKAENLVNEIRLLTLKELKMLFPNSKVYKEKLLFFNKSYTMYFDGSEQKR